VAQNMGEVNYPKDIKLLYLSLPMYKLYYDGLYIEMYDAIDEGDTVVIIGGGPGFGIVHAVQAGAGSVTVYEASREMINMHQKIINFNLNDEQIN
jgi:hypothetical protein